MAIGMAIGMAIHSIAIIKKGAKSGINPNLTPIYLFFKKLSYWKITSKISAFPSTTIVFVLASNPKFT